jgi:PAS domain S-box-containing protein
MGDDRARIAELEAELVRLQAEMATERCVHAAALAQLRLSEEKFAKAFHATPDSVNINRASDGVYLAVNPGFLALTGFTEAEVIGRSSLELDIWARPEDRAELLRQLRASGAAEIEAEFRVKNGSIRFGLMSARTIDVDGVPCILSMTRDISARLTTEEKLRQLVDLAADAIISVDPRWCIVSVNRQGCELVGAPAAELIGRHLSSIFSPDSLAKRPLRFGELAGDGVLAVEREVARADG